MEEELEKEFLSYDISLKLKELGFDKICLAVHYKGKLHLVKNFNINNVDLYVANEFGGILAPLWQQVINWFREEHNYNITYNILEKDGCGYYVFKGGEFQSKFKVLSKRFDYYEAHEKAILKAIELIKDKK